MILLPWQHNGFQTFPKLKAFLATLIFANGASYAWQAYEYVNSSSWPHLMFFELKITNILKSSG